MAPGTIVTTGPLTYTASVGPISRTTGLLTLDNAGGDAWGCPPDYIPTDYTWSIHGEARSSATAQFGLLTTSGFILSSGRTDAPCGGPQPPEPTAFARAEFLDDWTITPDDPGISGTGTLVLDVEASGTGTNYYDGRWATATSISTGRSWAIPDGGGSYSFSRSFQFGELFTVAFELEHFASTQSDRSLSTTNTFSIVGMRVFDDEDVEITRFRLRTSSGYDYGLGHQ
jgi:hypothetical protein